MTMHPLEFRPAIGEPRIAELIMDFRGGDHTAFRALVSHFTGKLTASLRKKLSKGPIAHRVDDILEEAWGKAFRDRDAYNPNVARFDVWLYRIALELRQRRPPQIASCDLDGEL